MPANTSRPPRAINNNLSFVFILNSYFIFRNVRLQSDVLYTKGRTRSDTVRSMKNPRISIKVSQEYRSLIEERASVADLTISAYIRYCLDKIGLESDSTGPQSDQVRPGADASPTLLAEQLTTKDQQIERLQSALDQSQQLHAMSEKRHESELDQIKGRSFLQRLKAVLVANP